MSKYGLWCVRVVCAGFLKAIGCQCFVGGVDTSLNFYLIKQDRLENGVLLVNLNVNIYPMGGCQGSG